MKRGNLLYNGDFETGTTEGWVNGAYGKAGDMPLSVASRAKLKGNYGGLLEGIDDMADNYIAYNKTCSFEEYEAYIGILNTKNIDCYYLQALVYGLDDKGNLIKIFPLSYDEEYNVWKNHQIIIRQFGHATHFQFGLYATSWTTGDALYFDECKLFPIKSIKGVVLRDYWTFDNLTSDTVKYSCIGCIGECKFYSMIHVSDVKGTSPTLDITIELGTIEDDYCWVTLNHSQFTSAGREVISAEVAEIGYILVEYNLGGSSPSFDIKHQIRIIPK